MLKIQKLLWFTLIMCNMSQSMAQDFDERILAARIAWEKDNGLDVARSQLYQAKMGSLPDVQKAYEKALASHEINPLITAPATIDLANILRKGLGRGKNLKRAHELFTSIAGNGSFDAGSKASAKLGLALTMLEQGGENNQKAARTLFDLILESTDVFVPTIRDDAKIALSRMLYEGQGGQQDLGRARTLYTELIASHPISDSDRADATLGLASTMLIQSGDDNQKKARSLLEKTLQEAKLNPRQTANVQILLGDMMLDGQGGNQDLAQARELFEKSLKAFELSPVLRARAERALAFTMLKQGKKEDQAQARLLFQSALETPGPSAEKPADAQVALGTMMLQGLGGDPDLERARTLFKEASEASQASEPNPVIQARAKTFLALTMLKQGHQQDQAQARFLLEEALKTPALVSRSLRADAQIRLGIIMFKGEGITPDLSRARGLFEEASNTAKAAAYPKTQARAQAWLALTMLKQGRQEDQAQASELLKQALATPGIDPKEFA